MINLKACPFCGAEEAFLGSVAEILCTDSDDPTFEWDDQHYAVVCNAQSGGCGSMTGCNNEAPEAAAEAWNRRARP